MIKIYLILLVLIFLAATGVVILNILEDIDFNLFNLNKNIFIRFVKQELFYAFAIFLFPFSLLILKEMSWMDDYKGE